MKIFIRNSEPVFAMATINPQLCKSGIRVEIEQRDEGTIPHVHVFHDQSRNKRKCSYIRLDTGDYFENHEGIRLGKHKDMFLKIMNTMWDGQSIKIKDSDENGNPTDKLIWVDATGYEAAVWIWLNTYPNSYGKLRFDKFGRPIMPDFSNL